MDYSNLIRGNLRKAFTLLKDLVEDVTLSQKSPKKFDFNTKSTETTAASVSTVKAIFVSQSNKASKDSNGLQSSFIFKTEDIKTPDIYDTITTKDGRVWSVVPPCTVDRFITTINVVGRPNV